MMRDTVESPIATRESVVGEKEVIGLATCPRGIILTDTTPQLIITVSTSVLSPKLSRVKPTTYVTNRKAGRYSDYVTRWIRQMGTRRVGLWDVRLVPLNAMALVALVTS